MNDHLKTKVQLIEELQGLRNQLMLHADLPQGSPSIRMSEQQRECPFSSVQTGMLWQSADGRIIHANRIASDIFGMPIEALKGRDSQDPIWHMVDESGNPVPGEKHPSMITLQTAKPVVNTVRGLFSDKSKEMLWLLISTEAIFSRGEGTPTGVFISFNDITELKKLELACLESANTFRALMNQSEECLILQDLEGNIIEVNQKACMTYMYSRQELLSMNTDELYLGSRTTRTSSSAWKKPGSKRPIIFSTLQKQKGGSVFQAEIQLCQVCLQGEQYFLGLHKDASECLAYKEKTRKSTANFLKIIEENPDAVIIVLKDGTIAYANYFACEMFGREKEELIGSPFGIPIGRDAATEVSIISPDRTLRYGGMRIIETEWEDQPANLVMMRDITGEKAAEENLKKTLEQLRNKSEETEALLSSANSILTDDDFATTARHIFDLCSRLCGATSGYVALLSEDGQGNELLFLEAGGLPCAVNPSLPMPLRGLRKEAYNSGKAVFDNEFNHSKWMKFMPEGHVALKNVLFAPLKIEGKTVGVIGIANKPGGFTEEDAERATAFGKMIAIALIKSRTNKQLNSERALLNFAIEQMPVPVIIADATDGKISKYNSRAVKILAQSGEDLDSIKFEELSRNWPAYHPDGNPFRPEEQPLTLAIREGKTIINQEIKFCDGESDRWFTVSAAPLHDKNGEIIAGIEIFPEITDLRRMEQEKSLIEEQYQQSQKVDSIGRLAGGIAHDLNNLLSPILGYAEMLQDDPVLDETLQEPIDEIKKAGIRARDLVHRLLAFSRKQTLEYTPINLSKTLEGFENLLRRTIRENVEISIITPKFTPTVMADVGQIEQVIMNLAVNAQDAMPKGGFLIISITPACLDENFASRHPGFKPGSYLLMSVIDTGCGMEKKILDNVFEPFFSTKGKKGTGLGLATVYGIVKQHNGNIWVYSEPGKGTTFQVYLPVSGKLNRQKNTARAEAPNLKGPETILLVEDDEQVLSLSKALLTRQGYKVLATNNGIEALNILKAAETPVHLLLSDVIMPVINGKELFKKASAIQPGIKVLYMSGYTDDVIADHGVLEEGTAFIQKPFSLKSLSSKVRETLDQ